MPKLTTFAAPLSPLVAFRQEQIRVDKLIETAERELEGFRAQGAAVHNLGAAITTIRDEDAAEFARWITGGQKGPEPKGRLVDISKLQAKIEEERYRAEMLRGVIADKQLELQPLYAERDRLHQAQNGHFVSALQQACHHDGCAIPGRSFGPSCRNGRDGGASVAQSIRSRTVLSISALSASITPRCRHISLPSIEAADSTLVVDLQETTERAPAMGGGSHG